MKQLVLILCTFTVVTVISTQEKPIPQKLSEPIPQVDVTLSKHKVVDRIKYLLKLNEDDKKTVNELIERIKFREAAVEGLKASITDTTLFAK